MEHKEKTRKRKLVQDRSDIKDNEEQIDDKLQNEENGNFLVAMQNEDDDSTDSEGDDESGDDLEDTDEDEGSGDGMTFRDDSEGDHESDDDVKNTDEDEGSGDEMAFLEDIEGDIQIEDEDSTDSEGDSEPDNDLKNRNENKGSGKEITFLDEESDEESSSDEELTNDKGNEGNKHEVSEVGEKTGNEHDALSFHMNNVANVNKDLELNESFIKIDERTYVFSKTPKDDKNVNKGVEVDNKSFFEKNVRNYIFKKPVKENDEYAYDSSDEEDIRNTVGNIPMEWYDDYRHLGYDLDGNKILRPKQEDQLDFFIRRMEDPDFWRMVKDHKTGQDVVLSDADVELIQRLQNAKIPDPNFNDTEPFVEWFSSKVMQTPIRSTPPHKRSFIPSKDLKQKVAKMVHAMKMGWVKPYKKKNKDEEPKFYMMWQSDDQAEEMRRIRNHVPAPKRLLPGHAESYNPPAEYLFSEKEMHNWLESGPSRRKLHFVPRKYSSLREVPAYSKYMFERFLRCLDLYMCPRQVKMKLTIQPEDLLPQLPDPKDLQPFPTTLSLTYKGHEDMVRCITIDPKGQYLASGSDDKTVKIWEIQTARCIRTIPAGDCVRSVAWCPNQALSLLLVSAGKTVFVINPKVGDALVVSKTDNILKEPPHQGDDIISERVKAAVRWELVADGNDLSKKGVRILLHHFKEVGQVSWHGRGDYFATVLPEGLNRSVIIHQLSKQKSQLPFSKSKGLIQHVLFHPIQPVLFVATQRHIRIYNLVRQNMIKKLESESRWISSMAIHSGGDNLLVGTYDSKTLWFDLDLSVKPYQILRLHSTAVRNVAYHKRYPLFASASDDLSVVVCHGMVYNDLLKNALIVPLKRLSSHTRYNDFGVLDVLFHPFQPWLFSSGADATIKLYT